MANVKIPFYCWENVYIETVNDSTFCNWRLYIDKFNKVLIVENTKTKEINRLYVDEKTYLKATRKKN